jgi:AraC family transcriptional regulator
VDHGPVFRRNGAEQLQLKIACSGGEMDASINVELRDKMSLRPVPLDRQHRSVCQGVTAETVCSRESFETRYCGPLHLLIAHERLARRRGETTIEGLPASKLRNLSRTLTFVPAGCKFREWHDPDIPSQAIYIHIDPHCVAMDGSAGAETLAPRLHFQNAVLWQTVLKVKALVEEGDGTGSRYADALGVLLTHELLHSDERPSAAPATVPGGLTAWHRRLVARYVEEHLAERIPVGKLADLARLSRYHFSRSFRRSFGVPPHRYHSIRKVERAKELLANRHLSITEIALDVGYHETSSFTAVFRKLVGQTPSTYRRSLIRNPG